jgi:hypothetical protein
MTQDGPAKFFDSRHQTPWELILGLTPGDSDKPPEEGVRLTSAADAHA